MSGDLIGSFVVADDRTAARDLLGVLCEKAGFAVVCCEDVAAAQIAIAQQLRAGTLVGVVTDLHMPGTEGQEWGGWQILRYAYQQSSQLALAAYTAYAGDDVVTLFKSGVAIPAFTIFEKPTDLDNLAQWLLQQQERWRSRLSLVLHDAPSAKLYNELAPIYSRSNMPILILGETGTGKEALARHIHRLSGRSGPFVAVNCGALEPSIAFGEFFGHQQGAFTDALRNDLGLVLRASGYREPKSAKERERFIDWLKRGNPDLGTDAGSASVSTLHHSEAAQRAAGTLFLDEVGSLPPKLMAGLLRLLATRDVIPLGHREHGIRAYCRIIAATNETHVLEFISRGVAASPRDPSTFRSDLFYRLSGAVLHLKPIRERDTAEISRFVASPHPWRELGLPPMPLDGDALESIEDLFHERTDAVARQYQNGNFRALLNLIHRSALIALAENSPRVAASHVALAIDHGALTVADSNTAGPDDDNEARIRARFRVFAGSRGVKLTPLFTTQELRDSATMSPILVAAAFIDCATANRDRPDPKKRYYDLGEIEVAITRGLTANAFLSKVLTKEHFRSAAIELFGFTEESLPPDCNIKDVVKKVRDRQAMTEDGATADMSPVDA